MIEHAHKLVTFSSVRVDSKKNLQAIDTLAASLEHKVYQHYMYALSASEWTLLEVIMEFFESMCSLHYVSYIHTYKLPAFLDIS
jgi:hypothetical protein